MNNKTAKQRRAFTLIEMLVVIAIIAILAALITWGAGRAAHARMIKRVQAEVMALSAAIDDYHAKLGTYPPDNTNDAAIPPLFYELTGTKFNPATSSYTTIKGDEQITQATIDTFFHLGGFVNSNPESTKNFLGSLKAGQYREISSSPDVEVLVVPAEGPNPFPAPAGSSDTRPINTWRYVSTKPTNNPTSYDLWAEIVVGGKTNIIGNWK